MGTVLSYLKDYWRILLEGSLLGAVIGTWICVNYAGWSKYPRKIIKSFAVIGIGILILVFTK